VEPFVRTSTDGGRVVVHVAGDVVGRAVTLLRRVLHALGDAGADVVVDLTSVTFIDSTGVGLLVAALRRTERHGGRLVLVIDQESVMKIFRITALTRLFTIHRTLGAALGR
jgi:anti-sigma B factor antagonist